MASDAGDAANAAGAAVQNADYEGVSGASCVVWRGLRWWHSANSATHLLQVWLTMLETLPTLQVPLLYRPETQLVMAARTYGLDTQRRKA